MSQKNDSATLQIGDKVFELPVFEGTEKERAIDIRKLRSDTGAIAFDPGYANTGACRSSVTFIDGDEGILRYRGYAIEDLAEKSNFLEVAYLLIHGELPSRPQFSDFTHRIHRHTMLHEDMRRLFSFLPKDAHPMAACATATGALATFYPDSLDPDRADQVEISILRLLAKFPTITAYAYKHSIGQPMLYPNNEKNYVENFLYMMFATPCEHYEVNPVVAKALDMLLILHADHEQNCSTSAVRLVGSSKTNLFAAISSGINALWGPLHGGANQAVLEMLEEIQNEGVSVREFVERAKTKNSTSRLMGFGHRVYKNFDPRAKIIKKACFAVLESLGIHSKLLEIGVELEEIALKDPYFIERKLYPNVDFYSGIIYKAIGCPVNLFTALFAMGRLPGWIAHWKEMHADPDFKIGRPRQIYTGATLRPYKRMPER